MSLTKRLSLATPPPKVVLLPDALFFVRAIEVPPTATSGEIAAQVELTLEAMAPFAVSQMYHGHHWRAGFAHALVFAAYRKRFSAEQTESWGDAEVVAPAFALLLNAKVARATTAMVTTAEGLTAIHWENPDDAPVAVIARPFEPEMDDGARARVRDEIFKKLGGTRTEIEVEAAPVVDVEDDSADRVFKSGALRSGFTREALDALDVRDKDDLAVRRAARMRDLMLWRAFLGCAAAVVFAGLLELAMIGGNFWQKDRLALLNRQAPVVAEINQAAELASRVEELSTKRLLPFEMLDIVAEKKPESLLFTNVSNSSKSGIYTLDVRALARESGDIVTYRTALSSVGVLQEVKFPAEDQQLGRSGGTTFRMIATFKEDAVKPGLAKPEAVKPEEAKPGEAKAGGAKTGDLKMEAKS